MVDLKNDWNEILKDLFSSENYQNIRAFLKKEYSNYTVYPNMHDIFNALKFTSFENVKVVLLGQDPYHNAGQAMGLCFSVPNGTDIPPSLVNIYKELKSDLGVPISTGGDLTSWAKQGVLMLNTVLTVRAGQANSHAKKGWEDFTDRIIKIVSEQKENLVFLLWGANARSKKALIDTKKHLVLECAHPSPLSAYNGFFGCKHFSKTNDYLVKHGKRSIDWNINN